MNCDGVCSESLCFSEGPKVTGCVFSPVLKWLNHACLRSFNAVTEDVLPILPVVRTQTIVKQILVC